MEAGQIGGKIEEEGKEARRRTRRRTKEMRRRKEKEGERSCDIDTKENKGMER